MSYNFGYTPYWNLSINELLNKARVVAFADKSLQNELARRVELLDYALEEANKVVFSLRDELRDLQRSGMPSNCSHCGEAFVDD